MQSLRSLQGVDLKGYVARASESVRSGALSAHMVSARAVLDTRDVAESTTGRQQQIRNAFALIENTKKAMFSGPLDDIIGELEKVIPENTKKTAAWKEVLSINSMLNDLGMGEGRPNMGEGFEATPMRRNTSDLEFMFSKEGVDVAKVEGKIRKKLEKLLQHLNRSLDDPKAMRSELAKFTGNTNTLEMADLGSTLHKAVARQDPEGYRAETIFTESIQALKEHFNASDQELESLLTSFQTRLNFYSRSDVYGEQKYREEMVSMLAEVEKHFGVDRAAQGGKVQQALQGLPEPAPVPEAVAQPQPVAAEAVPEIAPEPAAPAPVAEDPPPLPSMASYYSPFSEDFIWQRSPDSPSLLPIPRVQWTSPPMAPETEQRDMGTDPFIEDAPKAEAPSADDKATQTELEPMAVPEAAVVKTDDSPPAPQKSESEALPEPISSTAEPVAPAPTKQYSYLHLAPKSQPKTTSAPGAFEGFGSSKLRTEFSDSTGTQTVGSYGHTADEDKVHTTGSLTTTVKRPDGSPPPSPTSFGTTSDVTPSGRLSPQIEPRAVSPGAFVGVEGAVGPKAEFSDSEDQTIGDYGRTSEEDRVQLTQGQVSKPVKKADDDSVSGTSLPADEVSAAEQEERSPSPVQLIRTPAVSSSTVTHKEEPLPTTQKEQEERSASSDSNEDKAGKS